MNSTNGLGNNTPAAFREMLDTASARTSPTCEKPAATIFRTELSADTDRGFRAMG